MRDVAIVSFVQSAVARDDRHNETEMLVPTIHAAIEQSGIAKNDLGFVCSGSLDYLQGGPFAFVSGLDAVGSWPPMRESHVEMDAAWAMYDMAALQARAYLDASGRDEDDLAEVAARAQRNGAFNPYAVRFGVIDAQQVLAQPVTHDPLRDADIAPITDEI